MYSENTPTRSRAALFVYGMLTGGLMLVLAASALLMAGCQGAAPAATPTPTKTPTTQVLDVASPTPLPVTDLATEPPVTSEPSATPTNVPEETGEATPPGEATATPAPAATLAPTPTTAPVQRPPVTRGMSSPDFGAQAFLWWRPEVADRDLGLMKDAGFTWVKQWFAWQDIEGAGRGQFDWTRTDRIVDQVEAHGLKLLVRASPAADKPFWGGNPPENADLFAEFVGAMAQRYRGRIQAYQIWNEPNLSREWGNKPVDPAGYARLLQKSYQAIKAADPNAIVVTAGMAPTTADQADAMYDEKFYRQMYEAMGGNSDGYFDMLGVHGAGYAVAPETDPASIASNPKFYNNDPSSPERLRVYSFRHIEDIRRIMEQYGDADKKVVVLEFGWTFDPRTDSPYYWHGAGAGIDPSVQGDYLVRSYQWAANNWPWVGLMSLIYMPDAQWQSDTEQFYWSIMDPSPPGQTFWRPAYIKLCIYLNGLVGQRCKYDPNQ